jgi:hypothetical protein
MAISRKALTTSMIGIYTRQSVGIVSQAFLADTLLDVIGRIDSNASVVLCIPQIDPIVAIRGDSVIVSEEDLISFDW